MNDAADVEKGVDMQFSATSAQSSAHRGSGSADAPAPKRADSPRAGAAPAHGTGGSEAADVIDPTDPGEVEVANIRRGNVILRRLRAAENYLDGKFNFEAMGVQRIPEDKRQSPQIANMMFFWFSLLFSPTLIPIGALGPIFGLSVHLAILISVVAILSGTFWPAFAATLAPRTGLRQIAVSRYAFGVWGSKLCGALNILVNVGYATISCILGGNLLSAASAESVPLVLGIVLIALLGLVVSFLGFHVVHLYERYAWIVAAFVVCVVWVQATPYFTPTPNVSRYSDIDLAGAGLSYFSLIFGVAVSWAPIAGDYYVHYPADVSPWLVFGLTYVGQAVPTMFVCLLGNYIGGAVLEYPDLGAAYGHGDVGKLLLEILPPRAWARTACVIFFLSFLGNLIANLYSSALCVQLAGRHFIAVPRSLWCTLLTAVVMALALGGRDLLEPILTNLLALLGYWTLAFSAVLLLEHLVFRPRLGGYDLTAWQDRRRMPWGVAGTGTLLLAIAVSFLGMNQTWFMSPGAKAIGVTGGDIGDYLVFAVSFIFYPVMRAVEIHLSGR